MPSNKHESPSRTSVLEIRDGLLKFGERVLWHGLDLAVEPGEFIAVLGPNGSGKTSLLKVLLGQYKLSGGSIRVGDHGVRKGDPDIGYVPQQRSVDPATPLRARDIVALGVDGHRWGCACHLRSSGSVSTTFLISWEPVTTQTHPWAPYPAVRCSACVWRTRWPVARACSCATNLF